MSDSPDDNTNTGDNTNAGMPPAEGSHARRDLFFGISIFLIVLSAVVALVASNPVSKEEATETSQPTATATTASHAILNVDFATIGHSDKTGPAVVGNRGDYWNPMHPAEGYNYTTDTAKINDVTKSGFKYADGTPSTMNVRMVNLGGGYAGRWAIHDPMFNGINYQYDIARGNNGQPAFIYISHLTPGKYDLYLYGPVGRYQVSVNGKSYGRKDSTQDESIVNAAKQWVEGVHYQRFSDITIQDDDQIEVDLIPSDNRTKDAPISGLQLAPAGTNIVSGVIHGTDAQAYIRQHARSNVSL